MEDRENYSSLPEFSEEPAGGAGLVLRHSTESRGLNRAIGGLRSPAALLVVVGLLVSICTNVILTVLLVGRPERGSSSDSAVRLRLTSVQSRYVRLCDDYRVLGRSCSRMVEPCGACPDGWLSSGEQCYFFSSDKLDWMSSRASCEEMGGHLCILTSMEQHDALDQESRRRGGFDYHYWIGLSDMEEEGDWRWVDNSTLQHKYWDQWSSEPDDHRSGGEQGEDCATLNSRSKTWFDVPCDHVYMRICQMAAVQLG